LGAERTWIIGINVGFMDAFGGGRERLAGDLGAEVKGDQLVVFGSEG
jgi:hypothetical protein